MIKLVVLKDGQAVSDFKQQAGDKEITIGRAPGCSVRLDDDAVSRLHAVIRFSGDLWILDKKASTGKVIVNKEEVENAPLKGGEEIQIAPFTLRVEINDPATVAANDGTSAEYDGEQENEKTSFMAVSSAAGFFRFEPGTASVTEFVMKSDLAVFGRASNCDVVLTEKRASRKHVEIRRQGLSFFLKDLNSANGTTVNGKPLKGEVELVPGDLIEIGECKIQFSIENKDFFSKQEEFLPVPAHLTEVEELAEAAEQEEPYQSDPMAMQGEPLASIDGFAVDTSVPAPEEKSIIKKLLKKYKSLPPIQRYIVIGIAAAMIFAFLGEPDDDTKKNPPKSQVQIKRGADGKPLRIFENLNEEKKKFVDKAYKDLLASMEKRDFAKMLEHSAKILTYVDDYHDTKTYVALAKKGMEEQEAAEREKKLNERKEKLRQEVAALEEKGRDIYKKAIDDPKARGDLNKLISEIYSKDPNSRVAQEWTNGIKEKEAAEKREKEIARQKELLRQSAELQFSAVEKEFSEGRYVIALAVVEKLKENGYSAKEYAEKVEDLKNKIRMKLSSIIDPLLQEAATQSKEGGDLVKSKESYLQVLKIDAKNKDALLGLDEIREKLHIRAKRFYAEGLLSDSIGDLVDAKEKFVKCQKTAPEDDVYKQKCKNKLLKYESFNQEAQP